MAKEVLELYQGAWQLFIRPIRVSYEEEDLGPQYMRFGERRYLRKDFELTNARGLKLKCSHYIPRVLHPSDVSDRSSLDIFERAKSRSIGSTAVQEKAEGKGKHNEIDQRDRNSVRDEEKVKTRRKQEGIGKKEKNQTYQNTSKTVKQNDVLIMKDNEKEQQTSEKLLVAQEEKNNELEIVDEQDDQAEEGIRHTDQTEEFEKKQVDAANEERNCREKQNGGKFVAATAYEKEERKMNREVDDCDDVQDRVTKKEGHEVLKGKKDVSTQQEVEKMGKDEEDIGERDNSTDEVGGNVLSSKEANFLSTEDSAVVKRKHNETDDSVNASHEEMEETGRLLSLKKESANCSASVSSQLHGENCVDDEVDLEEECVSAPLDRTVTSDDTFLLESEEDALQTGAVLPSSEDMERGRHVGKGEQGVVEQKRNSPSLEEGVRILCSDLYLLSADDLVERLQQWDTCSDVTGLTKDEMVRRLLGHMFGDDLIRSIVPPLSKRDLARNTTPQEKDEYSPPRANGVGAVRSTRTDTNERCLQQDTSVVYGVEGVVDECYPSPCPCVVYLHGNSGCRVDAMNCLPLLASYGISLLSVDLSGSGHSEGEYISLGHYEQQDVRAIVDYLKKQPAVSRIGLWGRSMGAATAILFAAQYPEDITCIVLDSPFSSLKKLTSEVVDDMQLSLPKFVVSGLFGIAMGMVRRTIKEKALFDIFKVLPVEGIRDCVIPAFFLHGKDDDFVRPHHSTILFEQHPGPDEIKDICFVPGDHNSIRPQEAMNRISQFLHLFLLNDAERQICPTATTVCPPPTALSMATASGREGEHDVLRSFLCRQVRGFDERTRFPHLVALCIGKRAVSIFHPFTGELSHRFPFQDISHYYVHDRDFLILRVPDHIDIDEDHEDHDSGIIAFCTPIAAECVDAISDSVQRLLDERRKKEKGRREKK